METLAAVEASEVLEDLEVVVEDLISANFASLEMVIQVVAKLVQLLALKVKLSVEPKDPAKPNVQIEI